MLGLFAIPFIAAVILFLLPLGNYLRPLAVVLSLLPLAMLLHGGMGWIGAEYQYAWFPALGIEFHLVMDPLSFLFVYLTAIIVPISILAVREPQLTFSNTFFGLVLLLQGLLIGFFTARDLVVFTIFWEGMLLPLYFIITLWGGPQRQAAAIKFLIYMIAGSVLMVLAVLALYFDAHAAGGVGTFNLDSLAKISGATPHAAILCGIFLLAFAVKTPLFPFHAWLPDAYCQAPLSGTILLSAVLSKAGIYGLLRVAMPLFPDIMDAWSPFLLNVAIFGVLYGGMAAWMQSDYKRLIAYSSFSHVNFVLAGLFVLSQVAHEGAILQALNHGITIAALFLVAGWLEERIGTTAIGPISGLAKFMPHLCWLTLFFVLSSVAVPGTNSFIGELLILFGLFGVNPWLAFALGLSIILSVIYMLRWMRKVYFEAPGFFQNAWIDLRKSEALIALPLIALVLWIGIYPSPLLQHIKPAAEKTNTVAVANLEETQ